MNTKHVRAPTILAVFTVLTALVGLWVRDSADPMRVARASGFRDLAFDSEVADNLALIFDRFETEVILCLEGRAQRHDLKITSFRMPHIRRSTVLGASSGSCPRDERVIGLWHNHPADPWERGGHKHNCYLSPADIRDFVRQEWAVVTVVACGPRTYAYWWRSDVVPVADRARIVWPVKEQIVIGDPGAGDAPAH